MESLSQSNITFQKEYSTKYDKVILSGYFSEKLDTFLYIKRLLNGDFIGNFFLKKQNILFLSKY